MTPVRIIAASTMKAMMVESRRALAKIHRTSAAAARPAMVHSFPVTLPIFRSSSAAQEPAPSLDLIPGGYRT